MANDNTPRRGWREKVEAGIYRVHRTACPATRDRKPGRRCGCPYSLAVPGDRPGKTRLVTHTGTLKEARTQRSLLLAAGTTGPALPEDIATVHGFAGEWFRAGAPRWSPATISSRDTAYRLRIGPRWGSTRLDKLTRTGIEAWVAQLLAKGEGRRAVQIAVETMRAMLGVARDADLIQTNAAERVRFPEAPPPERTIGDRILDDEGVQQLLDACRRLDHETMIRAAVEAGLRRGEITALTWPDVHLRERRLRIRQSIWQDAVVGKVQRRPKMGRIGNVAITATFAERLAAWHHESIIERGGDAAGPVWPGRDGGFMSPYTVTHLVVRLARRAGLVDDQGRNLVHLHGLRHSAGSIALSKGVPITVVAAQLRHARPDFTMSTYAHILGDRELDRFADAHAFSQGLAEGKE